MKMAISTIAMTKTAMLLAGVSVLAAAPAIAQQSEGGFDEILVTALRTTTKLQETPIAITALTQEALSDQQLGTSKNPCPSGADLIHCS
jgi:iron complex outermembrane receptor protein